jgi:hypothetical protein
MRRRLTVFSGARNIVRIRTRCRRLETGQVRCRNAVDETPHLISISLMLASSIQSRLIDL